MERTTDQPFFTRGCIIILRQMEQRSLFGNDTGAESAEKGALLAMANSTPSVAFRQDAPFLEHLPRGNILAFC